MLTPDGGRGPLQRAWPILRVVMGFALAGLALWVLYGRGGEFRAGFFGQLRWWWLPVAVAAEAASFIAFAGMQHRLLRTGSVWSPTGPMVGMTLASQAVSNSFPGGPALAAVYSFRWYRRFGADDALATWTLVGVAVLSGLSLALLSVAGLGLATSQGASLDLVAVLVAVLVVTVAAAVLFLRPAPVLFVATWLVATSRRLTGHPREDLAAKVGQFVERILEVPLGWWGLVSVVGWSFAGWLFDCTCFAVSFLAVGAGIPWKGLLLAYGAGQLAANLPITPGGLGVVEGSITIALVAFGDNGAAGAAAVFVYRLVSFWLELVVGWGAFGVLALGIRRGRWARRAMAAPVAGPALGEQRVQLATLSSDPPPDSELTA